MAYKKPEKTIVKLDISNKMIEKLDEKSEEMGISRAELLRSIVTGWVAKRI